MGLVLAVSCRQMFFSLDPDTVFGLSVAGRSLFNCSPEPRHIHVHVMVILIQKVRMFRIKKKQDTEKKIFKLFLFLLRFDIQCNKLITCALFFFFISFFSRLSAVHA